MLDYRPDLESDDYRILDTATYVIPFNGGYRTSMAAEASGYNTALAANCIGARAVKNDAGTVRAFFGAAAAIYEADGASGWTDRSRGGGYTSGSNRWWFSQGIAANEVIACNYADEMQVSTGAAFSNLTNAPKARIVVAQSEALLAMYYNDGTAYTNGIKISDRGNSTTWTPAASNEATAVRLVESPGEIVAGAALNDEVIAWKRRSMYVGRYTGDSADPWQFNLKSNYIGCLGLEAWVATPAGIIFASENGVYIYDGSFPRQIDGGLTALLRTQYYSDNSYGATAQMSHDEYHGCVFLWIPDSGGAGSDSCFCYSYRDDRWSVAYATSLGAGSTHTGFQQQVRDYSVIDHKNLAGSTPTAQYVGHFIVSDQKKLINLSNNDDAGIDGFTPTIQTKRFQLSNKPNGIGTIRRVFAIWGKTPAEPTAGTCSVTTYNYPGSLTSVGSASTSTMNNGRFDLTVSGNNASVLISTDDKIFNIKDIAVDIVPAGEA